MVKRITKKDTEAIFTAIDFISSNSDGADNAKPFQDMMRRLDKIYFILKKRLSK